jgi:conjugal transfer pilus assembly protein TraE
VKLSDQQLDIKTLRSSNRGLGVAVAMLSGGLLLALVVILNILGSERTVLTPPTIEKTFWVSKDKASASYLEQMAGYMSWLILDVTPASIDWKKSTLLEYVDPSTDGAMRMRQDLESARLKQMNATTYFLPQQFVANEAQQSVVVRGKLRTQVNGADTSVDNKAYLVEFRFAGGRIHLAAFKEISYQQPNSMQTRTPVSSANAGVCQTQ